MTAKMENQMEENMESTMETGIVAAQKVYKLQS